MDRHREQAGTENRWPATEKNKRETLRPAKPAAGLRTISARTERRIWPRPQEKQQPKTWIANTRPQIEVSAQETSSFRKQRQS
jgi:hypothetical protein